MHFYPRTLKSEWYMCNVCDSIFTSLEAIKNSTAFYYGNNCEREAYLAAFKNCQDIVRNNDLHPDAMLQALSDWHSLIILDKYPFFSWTRWAYDVPGARDTAVRVAFQLVDSISKRFL